ncbi:MAG TPA: hypothetical protein VGR08_01300 [Thermomicrobiales bacterium]|nr:hypothetical protein [Thermomicrobiales bacterium]
MRRQIIFGTLLLLTIGGIVAAIIWGPDGDWDRTRGDTVEIVRIADDGTGSAATNGTGEVIVIEGQRPFFFPFGLLIVPLVIFLLFGLFRGAFFGWGGPRGGPGRFIDGPDGAWLEDWHRRQHQGDAAPDDTHPGQTPDRQA